MDRLFLVCGFFYGTAASFTTIIAGQFWTGRIDLVGPTDHLPELSISVKQQAHPMASILHAQDHDNRCSFDDITIDNGDLLAIFRSDALKFLRHFTDRVKLVDYFYLFCTFAC